MRVVHRVTFLFEVVHIIYKLIISYTLLTKINVTQNEVVHSYINCAGSIFATIIVMEKIHGLCSRDITVNYIILKFYRNCANLQE